MKKIYTVMLAALMMIAAVSLAVAADQTGDVPTGPNKGQGTPISVDELIQRLETQKDTIEQQLSDGKITEDQAEEAINVIDERIGDLEAFEEMSTAEKKEKLLSDYTTQIDKMLEEGKMTEEQADEAAEKFKAYLEAWDGEGYPMFGDFGGGLSQGQGRPGFGQGGFQQGQQGPQGQNTPNFDDPKFQGYKKGVVMSIGSSAAFKDGSRVQIDKDKTTVTPIVSGGRTLVPLRFISENFGAEVEWNADTSQATIKTEKSTAVFTLNSKTMILDGKEVALDVAPQQKDGRLMIPVRVIAENVLGKNISYKDNVIYISDEAAELNSDTATSFLGMLKNMK